MAELEMANAFKLAATHYLPVLPIPTLVFFHKLEKPNKRVVRLLFNDTEINDPKRLEPFVILGRAPLVYKVEFDLVEVVRDKELWLVNTESINGQPPTYEWISSTDEFLGIGNGPMQRTGPDPDAVARWRTASGDGDLVPDKEEGVKGPPQDH